MKRKISTLLVASAVLALGMALMPLNVVAKKPQPNLTVDCDADKSLQAAIDRAAYGDEIIVQGNCADGPYFVNKDLQITGPATLSSPNGGHDVIFIQGAHVTLRSLHFDAANINTRGISVEGGQVLMFGGSVTGAKEDGIQAMGSSWVSLHDCEFSNNYNGIHADLSTSIFIRRCSISNNESFGVLALSDSSIYIANDNIIENNRDGVWAAAYSSMQIGNANIIRNNTKFGVVAATVGHIWFTEPPPNTIEDNGVSDVVCFNRGVVESLSKQISSSSVTMISDDCLINGEIF